MGEKGGKGFSLNSNLGKSSTKSPLEASLTGKDDSTAKSKRGRKVQFNNGGLPEARLTSSLMSGGKTDIPIAKGDLSKGGKGGRVLNGEKSAVPKPPAPLELRIEQELPKNAKCMMDCEAALILKGIQEQMVVLSEDPTIKIPLSFNKGLQYAQSSNCYASPQSVRLVLEPLSKYGVSDGEICVIANTCPETIDEVFALVPSLKPKWSTLREPLKDVLRGLAELKHSNQSSNPERSPGFS